MSHMEFSHPYFGAFFLLVFGFVAFLAVVSLSNFLGKKLSRSNDEKLKLTIYECGFPVTKQPNSFSSHFYLYALLFILFDIEIVFMFPWAVNFEFLGMFGFVEMVLFVALLTIGFVYAWSKGALEWHSIK